MPPDDFDGVYDPSSPFALAATYARSTLEGVRRRRRFDEVEKFCFFVGYPRSGHSLVGSLLDAHHDMVIAHELDALRFVQHGFRRHQLFALLLRNDAAFTASGRNWEGYNFTIQNQHQGSFQRLRVIGDKRGMMSTVRLARYPGLLDKLRGVVGVPLRVIHVTRNPYDNITTMATRADKKIRRCTREYLQLSDALEEIRGRLAPEEILDVRYEDVGADPGGSLARMCRFLSVDAPTDYLEDCARIVKPASRTRSQHQWTDEERQRVRDEIIDRHESLHGYSFDA